MQSPTIPTVPDTVRAYTRRFFFGDSAGWRTAPMSVVIFVSALLLVAPVNASERMMPLAIAIFGSVAAIDAAHREYRFGGPAGLILVAALTTGVITTLVLVPVVAVRGAVGGPPLPFFEGVVALGIVALLVAYLGRGWWKRAEAAFEAEVRAERARRGAGAVHVAMTGPDLGRQMPAYLFFLALGGFGLLLTGFAWTKNADWLTVAMGLVLNGSLTIWALLGIRRARASGR